MLRAAVIGLGVGERHIAGYERHPDCRVTTLCDIDAAKLAEVGSRNPGRRLVSDPAAVLANPEIDVVSIASYDDVHCDQVVAAFDAGKHVFCEKPLCLTDAEFARIRAAHGARPHLRLSSNLVLRKSPRFADLRRRIQAGDLGEVYHIEGDYNYGRIHKIIEGWRGHIPFYSVVHGGAIHLVDLMMWLTGRRVLEVSAIGTRLATRDTSFRHNDTVVALLRFEGGVVGKVGADFACTYPHFHRLSVYGTEGTFENAPDAARLFGSRDPAVMPELVTSPYKGADKGDLIASFVQSIIDGSRPEVGEDDVYWAMATCLAIEKAIHSNRMEAVDTVASGEFGNSEA